jgi:hypothetical protein
MQGKPPPPSRAAWLRGVQIWTGAKSLILKNKNKARHKGGTRGGSGGGRRGAAEDRGNGRSCEAVVDASGRRAIARRPAPKGQPGPARWPKGRRAATSAPRGRRQGDARADAAALRGSRRRRPRGSASACACADATRATCHWQVAIARRGAGPQPSISCAHRPAELARSSRAVTALAVRVAQPRGTCALPTLGRTRSSRRPARRRVSPSCPMCRRR